MSEAKFDGHAGQSGPIAGCSDAERTSGQQLDEVNRVIARAERPSANAFYCYLFGHMPEEERPFWNAQARRAERERSGPSNKRISSSEPS